MTLQAVKDLVLKIAAGERLRAKICFDFLELDGLSLKDGISILVALGSPEQFDVFCQNDFCTFVIKAAIAIQYPEEAAIVLPAYNTFGWTAHRIAAHWGQTHPDKPLSTWGVKIPSP